MEHSISIPPGHKAIVNGTIVKAADRARVKLKGSELIELDELLKKQMVLARSVVNTKEAVVAVRVLNVRKNARKLKKGMVLGQDEINEHYDHHEYSQADEI